MKLKQQRKAEQAVWVGITNVAMTVMTNPESPVSIGLCFSFFITTRLCLIMFVMFDYLSLSICILFSLSNVPLLLLLHPVDLQQDGLSLSSWSCSRFLLLKGSTVLKTIQIEIEIKLKLKLKLNDKL